PANPPQGVATEETAGGAAGPKRYRFTAFGIYDMNLQLESPLKTAARIEKPERDLTLRQLMAKIEEDRNDPGHRPPPQAGLHKRCAFPVAAFIFVLLGFPLAVRSHRGGRSVAMVGTLGILVSYYLILTTLEGMAIRERLPVWLAIWMPNILFGAIGAALLGITAREWRAPHLPHGRRVIRGVWQRVAPRRPRWGE